MCSTDCFLLLLAVLFPPVAVWIKRGICSADSLINICLCMLGVLPGLLHAWYIVFKYPDPYEYEHLHSSEEHGNSRTHTIAPGRGNGQQANYGTVGSQPSGGQFHGQQSGIVNAFPQPKTNGHSAQPQNGVAGQELGGEGSSGQPAGPPPTYADVIKGDNKVQGP
ncbi:hypothetical protein K504DRAFT_467995 [Pleomassaria siparia CBS 279.74]|uniref:Uncharacterized protein n=1 Tax=Pleomassaria siparia CBS 279.74 TaxID=1314801 RepID=A0A6G1K7H4_9PLEO|nr:hypothetical protein K504DRAFT_467995 [Pleomassaria siparia CBS 279.74]